METRDLTPPVDIEALSAYLDGQLTVAERQAVEANLAASAAWRAELEGLRWVRSLLAQAPEIPLPRSFELPVTATAARPAERPRRAAWWDTRWLYGFLRSAAAVTTALLLAVTGYDAYQRSTPTVTSLRAPEAAQAPAAQAPAPVPPAAPRTAEPTAAAAPKAAHQAAPAAPAAKAAAESAPAAASAAKAPEAQARSAEPAPTQSKAGPAQSLAAPTEAPPVIQAPGVRPGVFPGGAAPSGSGAGDPGGRGAGGGGGASGPETGDASTAVDKPMAYLEPFAKAAPATAARPLPVRGAPGWGVPWTTIQVALAGLALALGVAALYVRRQL